MMGSINHGNYNPRSSQDENTRLDSTWVLCGEVESKREFFSRLDFITFLKNVVPKFLTQIFLSKDFYTKFFEQKFLTQNFLRKFLTKKFLTKNFDQNVIPKNLVEKFHQILFA